ncbi:MAG: hypothetical protein JSV37_02100 [Anaerolineaceae bacterium]|nr:MAG: hypothetical protein JSV37_02100 [Anaerolineaceae bacterium]
MHHRGSVLRLWLVFATFALLLTPVSFVYAQSTRIIFLHHSCGANLIEQGDVRGGLSALGYEFFDHGYNEEGLRLANGSHSGRNFNVPGDNTDPDGYAAIFAQPLHDPPDNTFSHLMQYDMIAFKSCYPTSNIWDDHVLAEYQSYYLSIRERMDQFPEKLFIIVTQPPEVPGNSDAAAAARARRFVNWLQSEEFLVGHPNIYVFDFFGLLAGEDNFLKAGYRFDDYDGHPNESANRAIGPIFVDFIHQAILSFETGGPRPTPMTSESLITVAHTEVPAEETSRILQPAITGMIDDFEMMEVYWDAMPDDMGSTIECTLMTGDAHGGQGLMQIQYQIVPGGWASCGRSFDPPQNWSTGLGLTIWVNSENAGLNVNFDLFAGDPNDPTPFLTSLEIPSTGWTQIVVPWSDLERASWASETGLPTFDPAQVIGYGFGFTTEEGQVENTLWIDDIGLFIAEEGPPVEEAEPTPPSEEVVAQEPPEEETPEDAPSRGICSSSAMFIPFVVVVLVLRKRRSAIE